MKEIEIKYKFCQLPLLLQIQIHCVDIRLIQFLHVVSLGLESRRQKPILDAHGLRFKYNGSGDFESVETACCGRSSNLLLKE
jgi:hypothetical protein